MKFSKSLPQDFKCSFARGIGYSQVYTVFLLHPYQVEQDLASHANKMKLLESDLDLAEERATDSTAKLKDAETRVEELERENKGLRKEIERIEGHSSPVVIVSISKQCTELANGGIYTYLIWPALP